MRGKRVNALKKSFQEKTGLAPHRSIFDRHKMMVKRSSAITKENPEGIVQLQSMVLVTNSVVRKLKKGYKNCPSSLK